MDQAEIKERLDCLCLASRKAARAITRAYEAKLRPLGIRATQFSLLTLILGHGKIGIGALAEVSATERSTLSRNLALLEVSGLIAIEPGDDARERTIRVTRKGTNLVEKALPVWREAQAAVAALIGSEGAAALRQIARSAVQ
jgi:DNA-binding MarR family transcriptional regulator